VHELPAAQQPAPKQKKLDKSISYTQ